MADRYLIIGTALYEVFTMPYRRLVLIEILLEMHFHFCGVLGINLSRDVCNEDCRESYSSFLLRNK